MDHRTEFLSEFLSEFLNVLPKDVLMFCRLFFSVRAPLMGSALLLSTVAYAGHGDQNAEDRPEGASSTPRMFSHERFATVEEALGGVNQEITALSDLNQALPALRQALASCSQEEKESEQKTRDQITCRLERLQKEHAEQVEEVSRLKEERRLLKEGRRLLEEKRCILEKMEKMKFDSRASDKKRENDPGSTETLQYSPLSSETLTPEDVRDGRASLPKPPATFADEGQELATPEDDGQEPASSSDDGRGR
ncbi:hypothetical protein EIL50_04430 [bacterium NHP-B]|nr:hypothetical protein EIL50_04430 [bacterium NHP-B]